jgi:hypothetical protein
MDFKNIIEKINLIEGIETKKIDLVVDIHGKTDIPEEDKKTIVLDESEAIKVLAGTRTLTEAAEIMEKKLTKAEKEKKEEVVKSMKKDKAGFKERYGKRGEEVMHATATKIAKKKAESQESDQESLAEAGLDMNLIKAASEKGMGARKSDPESDRNINKPYGYRSDKAMDDDDDDEPKAKKRKAKKESVDPQQFRDKFFALVEAKKREAEMKTAKGKKAEEKMDEGKKSTKKKPDDDGDGVPNWADKKPGEDDHADKKPAGKKGMTAAQKKLPPGLQKAIAAKKGKKKSVKESFFESEEEGVEDLIAAADEEHTQPGRHIDNLQDVMNATIDADDSPEFKKARAIINRYLELVTNADVDHYDDDDDDPSAPAIGRMAHGDIARHIREYDLGDYLAAAINMLEKSKRRVGEGRKTSGKKVMKESVEPKMSFRDMMRLVVESGGQQQIDPLDKELFAWATRVARNKLGEGMKSEVYAGLVYERMGGRFEMYDVLSENLNESRVRLNEGMLDKVKSFIMSKVAPKFSSEEKDKMKSAAQRVLGKSEVDPSDFTLDNIKAISKALGVKAPATESIEEGPIGDFFSQKKVDPKSGKGTLGPIDAWDKNATLGEKLTSVAGMLGGAAMTIAGFFGGPAWLILPGALSLMLLSQIGTSKSDHGSGS